MTPKGRDLDVQVFSVTGPPPPYQQNDKFVEQEITKPKNSKKCCLILGVTTVFVVALVAAAVLLGMHLRHKHRDDCVKEMNIRTQDGEEKISVNTETDEQEFELPDRQFHVLHNFKQGVSVYKMHYDGRPACFLRPLDKTGRPDPETLATFIESGRHPEARVGQGDVHRKEGIYIPVTLESSDLYKSFRSQRASELCQGLMRYRLYTESDREDDRPLPASDIAAAPMARNGCTIVFCYPPETKCWIEEVCGVFTCRHEQKCETIRRCVVRCPS